MRVKRVIATGFFTYGKLLLQPADALTVLLGENGSGKSTAYEAICFALYGETVRGTRVRSGESRVTFDHGGHVYTVQRTRTERATKVTLWCDHPRGEDEDISGATTTETQRKIDALVGSYERFCASRVFARDLLARFGVATDKARKELLEEALGLGQFDRALVLSRKELIEARTSLAAADARVPLLADKVGAAQERAGEMRMLGHRPTAEVAAERDAVAAEHKAAKEAWAASEDRWSELARLSDTAAREAAMAEMSGVAAETRVRSAEVGLANPQRACDRCNRPFDEASIKASHEFCENAVRQARETSNEVAKVFRAAKLKAALLREEFEELGELRVAHLQAQGARAGKHSALKAEAALSEGAEAAAREADAALERATRELRDAEAARAQATKRVSLAEACGEAFGQRGAKGALLGDVLGGLEAAANAVLSRVAPGISIGLAASKTQASGKEVDEVSLVVRGAGGGEYKGCSGGQRACIDIALLVGLSGLQGGEGLLVFDEVFDSLSEGPMLALAEYLGELSHERQVLVISPRDDLAQLLPRAKKMRAVLDADVSRLEAA